MKDLLKKLSEAHGASGYEENIAKIMVEELSKYSESVEIDKIGNVIARKGSGDPKIMLAAHMDEIGFVVQHIDAKGFIWFILIGGFYDPTIFNARVLIHTSKGDVCGVVGSKPPHLMEEEEKTKPVKWKELFIDVGANSKLDAENLGISVGDSITFDQEFRMLDRDTVTGKSMDNRVGCLMLIEVMKRINNPKCSVYAVATVQEEVGLKGARVAAAKIKPDYGVVLDVSFGDQPGVKEREITTALGKGPIITYIEANGRGLMADPKMCKKIIDIAKANNIPYQAEVTYGGMTDAAIMYITGEGIPCISLGIPTRYIHSPVEVLDIDDVKAGIFLLIKFLESF
ncbi:MAG: M42 family metallopeptidase [Candidatus Nanoarchaeia archaeon]|nr:M42 family metallopeptidase [Candidatus Nanoarchaeia archaeon]